MCSAIECSTMYHSLLWSFVQLLPLLWMRTMLWVLLVHIRKPYIICTRNLYVIWVSLDTDGASVDIWFLWQNAANLWLWTALPLHLIRPDKLYEDKLYEDDFNRAPVITDWQLERISNAKYHQFLCRALSLMHGGTDLMRIQEHGN